eukprot:3175254-Pleurochrysis_carterae.AAC.1
MLAYVLDFNGLVYRLTKYGPCVLVPRQRCFALVHSYHRLLETGGHRGAAAIWPIACCSTTIGMECLRIVSRCVNTVRMVCRNRDVPSGGGAVAQKVMKDPPFPFHTVSVDHKTVTAPRGTKYQYIL